MGIPSSIVNGIADFFNNIITLLGKLINYINPLSEDFILKTIIEGIVDIVEFILNFFTNLLDFIKNIIIPTEEQQIEIANSYEELGNKVRDKLPFIGWFKDTINNATIDGLGDRDFLVITVPSFSFFGGQTEEKQYFDVLNAYEPYRDNVRSKLSLLVYFGASLFLIKKVLFNNTNSTSGKEDSE